MSTKDYWPNIDDHLDKLQSTWDKYLDEEYPYKIDKNTDAYQKVIYNVIIISQIDWHYFRW